MPPAAVLPERLIHWSGRVIPGQFGGLMGPQRDPWFIEASPYHATSYGAYPPYLFDHQERGHKDERVFQAPSLSLPQGIDSPRLSGRANLLAALQEQREELDRTALATNFDHLRQRAISLLTDAKVTGALNVTRADERTQERYGKNSFGWSLLMAKRLVEAGVILVQVNLGNNESWDTHGEAFPHLKDKLLPPTDRAVSALLDDLHRDGRRIRPHTEDHATGECLSEAGARPLGRGADGVLRGRRCEGWPGDRRVGPDRRLSGRQPANARKHGRHDLRRSWNSCDDRLAR